MTPPAADPWPHANRCVHTRLTPWAPGCIDAGWSDPRLRRDYRSVPLVKVIASLLRRLGRAPGEITLVEVVEGEIELRGDIPRDLGPHQVGPGLLVLLWGGPSLAQVQAALDQLQAAAWRPGPWMPPAASAAAVVSLFPSPSQGVPA